MGRYSNRQLEEVAALLESQGEAKSAATVRGLKGRERPPMPAPSPAEVQPRLTVRFHPMPESNGKRNWTVLLSRVSWPEGDGPLGDIASGICVHRSEYYDRARYDADRMRYLIGELPEEPFILDYDADLREPPKAEPVVVPMAKDERPYCSADGCSGREPCGPYCRDRGNFK
jgi:hypothetical protein